MIHSTLSQTSQRRDLVGVCGEGEDGSSSLVNNFTVIPRKDANAVKFVKHFIPRNAADALRE